MKSTAHVSYFWSFLRVVLVGACLGGLLDCGRREPAEQPRFVKMAPARWPPVTDHFPKETMLAAIDRQLAWLAARDAVEPLVLNEDVLDKSRLTRTLQTFRAVWAAHAEDPSRLEAELKARFDLYHVVWDGAPGVQVTGYFSPIYEGSLTPDDRFRHPLYALPKDMVFLRPDGFDDVMLLPGERLRGDRLPARFDTATGEVSAYFTRAQIDGEGALAGRGLELVYLDHYFRTFLFQVQGGGFVRLRDGRYLKLDYAGKNGWRYVSIGRLLKERGVLAEDEVSIQAIWAYFEREPNAVAPLCFENPSYVFYRQGGAPAATIEPDQFPHGSLGFPVTPERSLALDKRWFPGGALALLRGEMAQGDGPPRPFSAFALDQDTGGAIRGGRVDFYLGAGEAAGEIAGRLNDEAGQLYILIAK